MRAPQSTASFAPCIEDDGLEDLEVRQVYQVLPDRTVKQRARDASESSTNPARTTSIHRTCSLRSSSRPRLHAGSDDHYERHALGAWSVAPINVQALH